MQTYSIAPSGNNARTPAPEDTLVVLASVRNLVAAGLDLKRLRTSMVHHMQLKDPRYSVNLPVDANGEVSVRLAAIADESGDLQQLLDGINDSAFSALTVVLDGLLTSEPSARAAPAAAAASPYEELTAAQVAERMKCSTPIVYQREKEGEFFAILAPARVHGRRYPAFQWFERLDRPLLKRVIEAYREAGLSTNELWNFLRTVQRQFDGKTGVDILLGASAPALNGMRAQERGDAVMDVVLEELSRTAV